MSDLSSKQVYSPYSPNMVDMILENKSIRENLTEYLDFLSSQYEKTNEARYRIKYNLLYPVLNHSLSKEKQVQFFNSFAISGNIYPIVKISDDSIVLNKF